MPEYDGEIRIKASIDADKIDSELQKLSSKLERQSEAVNRQSLAVEKLKQKYQELSSGNKQTSEELGIIKQLKELDKQIDVLENKIHGKNFELLPDVTKSGVIKQFDELTEKSIKLRAELEKIKLDPKSAESMKRLAREIENGENKSQRLNSELRQTESEFTKLSLQKTNNFTKKIDEARNAIIKMGKENKGVFQGLGESVSGFGSRIMNLAKAAFVFNIISVGLKKLQEHFSNLISQDNQLNNSLNQVRANLLTSFMPIWQAILPALQALGKALAWVTSHIAAFVSMLFGKSVQQSQAAAKTYISNANALGKQAKGYDKVGKAAKKAKRELASFDKIEVLRQKDKTPKNSGSSGGGSKIETPKILGGFKNIDTSIIDRVRKVFERLKKPFENWDLAPLRREFERLWEVLKRYGNRIGEGLWWFYENVLAPLAKWTIGEVLPRFLRILTAVLELLEPIIEQAAEDLKYLWDNFLKPAAEWAGSQITEFLDNLAEAFETLGITLKDNKELTGFISKFIVGLLMLAAAPVLKTIGLITGLLWIINKLIRAFKGLDEQSEETFEGMSEASNEANENIIRNWGHFGLWIYEKVIKPIQDKWNEMCGKISGWFNEKVKIPLQRMFESIGELWEEKVSAPLRDVWDKTASGWKPALNGIISMFESFVNKIIGGINLLTGALNKVGFDVPDWLGGGHFGISIPKISNVSLPRLAQGAVLEGGNPFLAWVNDQPRGQTNIETPLPTMVQAFKEAMNDMPKNNQPIILEANGDFAGFIRFLNLKLKQENARVGQSFAVGDSWI